MVQVVDETTNTVIYTLRVSGSKFQPKTFKPGLYTIRVSDPEKGTMKEEKGVEATETNDVILNISL